MWFSILFGLSLIALSAVMFVRNGAAWRSAQADELQEPDHDFLHRQYRRRTQANWLIAIIGLSVIVGVWVTDSVVGATYWLGVILLVCWLALLAVADLVTTRSYYGRLHQDQEAERAILEAELDEIKRRGSNGRPKHEPSEDQE